MSFVYCVNISLNINKISFAFSHQRNGPTMKNSQFHLPSDKNTLFSLSSDGQASKQANDWVNKPANVYAIHSVWSSRFNEPDLLILRFINSQIYFWDIKSSKKNQLLSLFSSFYNNNIEWKLKKNIFIRKWLQHSKKTLWNCIWCLLYNE